MNYNQRNLLLFTLRILNEHAKLSLRDAAKIANYLGCKISHEKISQEFQLIDAIGTRNWWRCLLGSNYPMAFKGLEDAKLKSAKKDSHRLSHLSKLPPKFCVEVLPRLEPNDPKKLQRLLAQKIHNAENSQKIPIDLNIADTLIALAIFRDLVAEGAFPSISPDNLWEKTDKNRLKFALCRYKDKGGYSLDNCAFRPHGENSTYARNRDGRAVGRSKGLTLREIDQGMKKQIQRQLDLKARIFGK